MHLLLVGMNHRSATLAEREALALGEDDALRVLSGLSSSPAVREAVVLSTCNRTEFYAATDDPAAARRAVASIVGAVKGADLHSLSASMYEHADSDVVAHLFRVASGLDSMVVGEPQIMNQVKDAHGRARRVGSTGPWLDRLFEWALRTGKRARTETAIGTGVVSVASAACELARRHIERLDGREVLVIGVGETCRIAATHLARYTPTGVTVANRTLENARALAAQIGARAIGLDGLDAALANADLVVSATSAPHAIVTGRAIRSAMAGRGGRPMVLVDLAVPRDVESEVAATAGVTLYTIDDIQSVVERSLARRADEVPHVEAVVLDEAARFDAWGRARVARLRNLTLVPQAGHVA